MYLLPSPQLVTRAVRVIDLITNLDMSAFHSLGGWNKMLERLEMEVAQCRQEVPFVLPTTVKSSSKAAPAPDSTSSPAVSLATPTVSMDTSSTSVGGDAMDTTEVGVSRPTPDHTPSLPQPMSKPCSSGVLYTCMPERAALIKSILNFLKKAIPDPTFSENMRTCECSTIIFLST